MSRPLLITGLDGVLVQPLLQLARPRQFEKLPDRAPEPENTVASRLLLCLKWIPLWWNWPIRVADTTTCNALVSRGHLFDITVVTSRPSELTGLTFRLLRRIGLSGRVRSLRTTKWGTSTAHHLLWLARVHFQIFVLVDDPATAELIARRCSDTEVLLLERPYNRDSWEHLPHHPNLRLVKPEELGATIDMLQSVA